MDFSYIIKAGTEIFRGISSQNDPSGNWFVYTDNDAKMYGNTVKKYIVTEDIRVINIQNGFFHIDYMNKVNEHFTGSAYNGSDIRKSFALVPLGLPDIEFQIQFLKSLGNTNINLNILEDYFSRFYFNKNRFSDYELDKYMVSCIRLFYHEEYEGFTNPIEYPSKINTPGNLKREIYLFNKDKIKFDKEINHEKTGGGEQGVVKPFSLGLTIEEICERTQRNFDEYFKKTGAHIILRDTGDGRQRTYIESPKRFTRKHKRRSTK